MADTKHATDRRVERTRQALREAFKACVIEKGFAATSIQDIADRADVNRGTFYIHFADKYALLDSVMREGFQEHLANALPPDPRWDQATLRLLIRAVLDNFELKYNHRQQLQSFVAEVAPLLERAMQQELQDLLLAWLRAADIAKTEMRVPLETVARVVSWAIFGAAIQWSQEPLVISADQMADDILAVVVAGLSPLIPEALSE
jgi:AcrR family transcriptional regulator